MAPLPPSSSLATTEDLEDVKDQLHTAQTTLIEWQQMCAETIAVWRQLIAQVTACCMLFAKCFMEVLLLLFRVAQGHCL